MKGLLLTINQNRIILQSHPLLRMYFDTENVIGFDFKNIVQNKDDMQSLLHAIDELEVNDLSQTNISVKLNRLADKFNHIHFDYHLDIQIVKNIIENEVIYMCIALDIDEMEEYYHLLRQKEELFAHSINILKDISITVLNEPSSKIAARKSIKMISELFNAENAIIRLLKSDRIIEKYVSWGIPGEYLSENIEIDPRNVPIYDRVLREKKIIIEENPEYGLGVLYSKLNHFNEIKMVVALPIINNEKLAGVLSMTFAKSNYKLLMESIDILENVGNELNFLLEKGDYFLELLDTTEKLRSLNIEIVTALAEAIETRDPYTKGHSERVAAYAVEIARNLGWDDYELDRLRTAGVLHDIGKVGIPDAVLLKPGNLSKPEFEIIKLHPEMSASIISEIESFVELIPWVRYHHENYDGTGYPYGMKGKDIPQGSRIISVADAFDAMTSDRPYRKGLHIERVRDIFSEGAGSQWDKEVVDCALSCLEVIREKIPPFFHIPERLEEFRHRVFNMNLMDGLFLYEYVYDEIVHQIEQEKNFSISLISLKKSISDFNSIEQKRALSTLIDIIKSHVHYPILATRYNYYDLIMLAPLTDKTFMKKVINKILVEFFQQTNLFYASNILSYPDDAESVDKLLSRLINEKNDLSVYN